MKAFCRLILVGTFFAGFAAAANAAPFCIEAQGIPPQCHYYDTSQCQREATQIAGDCTVDPAILKGKEGQGAYCLIDSALVVRCLYPDPNSCNAEAMRGSGICVANPADVNRE